MPQETRQVTDHRAVEWAADNSWFGSDDEMTAYAMGVHSKLVKQGVDTSSDEYYECYRRPYAKNTFPEEFEGAEQGTKGTKRQC
jgi:hypothetical protein